LKRLFSSLARINWLRKQGAYKVDTCLLMELINSRRPDVMARPGNVQPGGIMRSGVLLLDRSI
jgi:hypothetical protein